MTDSLLPLISTLPAADPARVPQAAQAEVADPTTLFALMFASLHGAAEPVAASAPGAAPVPARLGPDGKPLPPDASGLPVPPGLDIALIVADPVPQTPAVVGSVLSDIAARQGLPLQAETARPMVAGQATLTVAAQPASAVLPSVTQTPVLPLPVAVAGEAGADGFLRELDAAGDARVRGAEVAALTGQAGGARATSEPVGLARYAVEVPVGRPGWNEALGQRVMFMTQNNVQTAELRLHPANLGPVEVRVQVHNNEATVSFVAAQGATREAIEAALPRLREMLNEAGLHLAQGSVTQQQSSGDGRQASGTGRGALADGQPGSWGGPDESDPSQTPVRVREGLLDDYA